MNHVQRVVLGEPTGGQLVWSKEDMWQSSDAVLLFVVATDSYRNGTFVRVHKNKYIWVIQVNFVVHAERENDVPDCGIDLRAMDLIVVTAVEDNTITESAKT
jgi:hypothetical protein